MPKIKNDVPKFYAISHDDCEHLLGKFLDASHFDLLIGSDVDFYAPVNPLKNGSDEYDVLFKFRKGLFTPEEQLAAHAGLIGAAGMSQNRGLAAGPRLETLGAREWVTDWQQTAFDILFEAGQRLDGEDALALHIAAKDTWKAEESPRGLVWVISRIAKEGHQYEGFFDRWLQTMLPLNLQQRKIEAEAFAAKYVSATNYANTVRSGIAGFFDRYPRIDWGRACSYNSQNPELFAKCYPYVRKLDALFKQFMPERYRNQLRAASKLDSRFRIANDTVFTTLTINKNFRTAAHRDAGDLKDGFSNLGVISAGKEFKGGYLVLPEFRVAIDIRPGDLLLIDNHRAIHGNTPILPVNEGDTEDDIERMSIVAYFREKMLNLGSWEYEQARFEFIEERRLNKNHPNWRPLWNGISPGWAKSQEWYDWLENHYPQLLKEYHPEGIKERNNDLSAFF